MPDIEPPVGRRWPPTRDKDGVMRGKILQYNGNDGSGVIVADGQQYAFNISLWKGNIAPAVGKTVDVVMKDGLIQSTIPVADDVLLKEKAAELKGRFDGLVGGLGASLAKGSAGEASMGGGAPAAGIIQFYGRNVLIAYVAFLLGTIAFNAISISFFGMSQGKPLYDLAELLSQMGGAGGVKMLLILSYLGIAVPYFWRDRRGWLALCLPMLAILWALWSGMHAVGQASSGAGGDGPGFFDFFSFGFGFYLSLAAAIYLALAGFRKFATS
jgi:hypothetical protein